MIYLQEGDPMIHHSGENKGGWSPHNEQFVQKFFFFFFLLGHYSQANIFPSASLFWTGLQTLSTPTFLTNYSPKLLFPAWLFIMSYSSCDLSNMLWLFFSLTGWIENPQRSLKMAAGTLPLKVLVRVRACHCRGAAGWMFIAVLISQTL